MLKRSIASTLCALFLLAGPALAEDAKTKVLFIAGRPSHAPGEHEHRAGCMLLAKKLEEGMPSIDAEVSWYGWPRDPKIFDGVSAIVMYCDGGGGHYANHELDFIQSLVDKKIGVVAIHYGVEVPIGPSGEKFLQWIGGYFETDWSVNPHWDAAFKSLPEHPITRGVSPFGTRDEWYYHMRFPADMNGVTPILTALPPMTTLTRPDGPHSGNPHVRKAVEAGEAQHVAWAIERPDGGRGFGFTGGHFHQGWQNDEQRRLVLNAIAWAAQVEVPAAGIATATPTDEEMKENLDDKKR